MKTFREVLRPLAGANTAIVFAILLIGTAASGPALPTMRTLVDLVVYPEPASPAELQSAVVAMAREAEESFAAAIDRKRPPLARDAFARTERALARISRLDPGNGHALYYRARIARWSGERAASDAMLLDYLMAASVGDAMQEADDGDARYCFQHWRGFCKQRAAFVNYLLATDFSSSAAEQKDPGVALRLHVRAVRHAIAAAEIYGGFAKPEQGPWARVLVRDLELRK